MASDQSSVDDWHDLQATRRSEEWSATYRKKVAAEAVFDRRALQFERACNRLSVVSLYRRLNASPKRNVARIIGSAGAGRGMHRLHGNGGWLRRRHHKKQAADIKHVRYCKERGPLRSPVVELCHVASACRASHRQSNHRTGMTIAEFQKTRNNPRAK